MDFEIKDHSYRSGRLDARKQFHVVRRLAPVLGELAKAAQNEGEDILMPLAEAIAKIPDADCDFILDHCLGVVSRRQGQGYSPVFSRGQLMFEDIDLRDMLQMAANVIQENLGSFFPASPVNSPSQATAAA